MGIHELVLGMLGGDATLFVVEDSDLKCHGYKKLARSANRWAEYDLISSRS